MVKQSASLGTGQACLGASSPCSGMKYLESHAGPTDVPIKSGQESWPQHVTKPWVHSVNSLAGKYYNKSSLVSVTPQIHRADVSRDKAVLCKGGCSTTTRMTEGNSRPGILQISNSLGVGPDASYTCTTKNYLGHRQGCGPIFFLPRASHRIGGIV